jgi:hypothetical protein
MSSSSRTGLVELLATWELTSLPGVPGLFRVMSSFRGLDELALLGRVADSPGIALVPGLRDQVRGVLRKAKEPSSVEPQFRQEVSDVVGKTSDALASYAEEQRETLQRDLLECAARLPHEDRESIFRRLWQDSGSGHGGRLDQVRAIDEAREMLDRVRKALGSDEERAARSAAEEDDPAAVAAARAGLEASMSRGEQLAKQAGAAPPVATELLTTMIADAKATLEKEKLALRTLVEQTQTLDTLIAGMSDPGFAASFAPPGGKGGGRAAAADGKAAEELRSALAFSTEELARIAGSLPTSQLVRFRTRLNEAEAAAYSDDGDAMRRWVDELREDGKEAGRLAERQRRFEEDRNAAEAERMAREIEALEAVARGRDAKRLRALRADLEQPKKRAGVARALPRVAAGVANNERLGLATLYRRASKCSEKSRGRMQAEMNAAEAALSGDDLAAVGQAADALKGALGKVAPWRGPRGAVVAAVLFVAILVGAVFGIRAMRGGNTTAAIPFELADGVGTVKFVLVHDGEIFAERSVSGGTVELSLPAGRFEVFVNDRYTGRVIRMPQDAGSIEPIEVPR